MFALCSRIHPNPRTLMTRRSTPQAKIDEAAWPVRIRIVVPPMGLGSQLNKIYAWLDQHLGRSEYALHADGGIVMDGERLDRVAIYVRHPADADALLEAIPLTLADGTMSGTYSSPALPFGRRIEDEIVCNLYSNTTTQEAMRRLFPGLNDRAGNLSPGEVYPDQLAAIIRQDEAGLALVKARWGMPSPQFALKTERDPGVTNVRNLSSSHWRRWLGAEHRCLVPLTSFAEPRGKGLGSQWFAPAGGRPMMFAGIEVRGWTSLRKVKDGETVDDLFAFLTCPPNNIVARVHPKAMPVILAEPDDWQAWLQGAPAVEFQRPLPDEVLELIEEPR